MRAAGFHDFIEKRNVKRHDGNGGTRLRDERLVHRNPRLAAERGELAVDGGAATLQIQLRAADGAIFVNWPSKDRSDVGVGQRAGAWREHSGGQEIIHPHLPILAAHHSRGLHDFLVVCRLDRNGSHLPIAGVQVFVRIGLSDGLENGFENLAGLRMRATG